MNKKATFFRLLAFILIFLSSFQLFSQTTETITNTGNGTFTVPCGVTTLTVEVWGAGGAGGGSTNSGGAGGGSGAYVKKTFNDLVGGETISFYIGQGGYGYTGQDGDDGEDTTLTYASTTLTAGGGNGGNRNQGQAGHGGTANGGDQNTNGGNGGNGGNNIGGNGGNAPNGGNGGYGNSNNNGGNGNAPGGGGGGGERHGNSNKKGGNGGNGRIAFTYTALTSSYCTPTFNNNAQITNVTFSGINNNSSDDNNYNNYCDEASVAPLGNYDISISSNTYGNNNFYITAYFDWNQDGDFSDTNESYNLGINHNNGTINNTISVPENATAGTTTMRIIQKYNSYPNNACGTNIQYGAAEDYKINVSDEATIAYCSPEIDQENKAYFSQVNFIGTLNDTENSSTYNYNGYQDFTNLEEHTSQAQGEGINIYLEIDYNDTSLQAVYAWVDWNKDGDFYDTDEEVYSSNGIGIYSTSFGLVIPENVEAGNYTLRLRTGSNNACDDATIGEIEDYTIEVIENCDATITNITEAENCGEGTVDLTVTGSTGTTEYRWYDAETDGNLLDTTTNQTWTTPTISETTTYYVTAYNGSCESIERTAVKATIRPVPTLGVTPENPVICGEDAIIELSADGETEQVYLIDEDFENNTLDSFQNQEVGSSSYGSNWQVHESPYIPTNTQVWFPAISSGFNGNKFALSTSDLGSSTEVNNALLLSTAVNTEDFTALTLSFDLYYSNYAGASDSDHMVLEVSTNNGSTWSTFHNFTNDVGIGTNFENQTFDFSAYTGYTQLKIRFRYIAGWRDGVAIDNIELYGNKPLTTSFLWSGASVDAYLDEACTIEYTEGTDTSSTVYIKPTLNQLQVGSYTFTVSAELSNGCVTSKDVTVTNNSKIWNATGTDLSWENPDNWSPYGVPTSENCIIVKDDFTSYIGADENGQAKEVKVKDGGEFTIESGGTLTVQESVNVEDSGYFHIENNGSLIQVEDVPNTGNITADRTTSISKYDYVYWSSPVASFNVQDISPNSPTWAIYEWIPTISGGFGNWNNTSEDMIDGKGYIVKAPNSYPVSTNQDFTATFEGTPNNGTITKSIQRGSYVGTGYSNLVNGIWITTFDDNWNLLGNPYPSAISATSFLETNTNIEGAIRIWTHGTSPNGDESDPFYNDFTYNYAITDYITYNATGSILGAIDFDGYIGTGQGFFVKMLDGSAATGTVTFNNSMRNEDYNNSQFYRPATPETAETIALEEGRIWLDLIDASENTTRTLVGYINGATNAKDRLYDAYADEGETQNLYSIINSAYMVIQGKALPFDDTDTVPLGILVSQTGTYTIAIAETDGIFSNGTQSDIYVEDTYLDITHNLTTSPYSFTIDTAGRYDDRFIIKYVEQDSALGLEDTTVNQNTIKAVAVSNQQIRVVSSEELIKDITVYTVNGQQLLALKDIQTQDTTFYTKKTNSALLIQITTITGAIITKKLMH